MSDEDQPQPAREPGFFAIPSLDEQGRMVEAMLFASADPLTVKDMAARMPEGCDPGTAVRALATQYEGRGVQIVQVGPAWAIRTAPDLSFLMRHEVVETRKLSRAALETLAIVAYHQPVTRAEIEEIRGVSVSKGTLDLLMDLDWVKLGPRKNTPGRPVTFATTQGFLDHFSLSSARDLPGLAEIRAAGLLEARGDLSSLMSGDTTPEEDAEDGDDDQGLLL